MFSSQKTAAGKWRLNREVVASRLAAAVAAAGLVAALTAAVIRPGPASLSHPRNWVVAVVCCLLGIRIVAHARRNAVGWLVLAMGVCGAIAVGTGAWPTVRWPAWFATWIWWPSYSLLPVILLIFPTGRLLSSRWRTVLAISVAGVLLPAIGIGWASWSSPVTFWEEAVRGAAKRGLPVYLAMVGFASFTVSLLSALAALVVRCRRATGSERRLLLWSIGCATLMIPAWLFETLVGMWGMWALVVAAFPLAALIAILRYDLYNIDLIIHRSLLYSLLALILIVGYIAIVLAATAPFPDQAHVIGTVAVVLTIAPLHRILRNRLDRALFGHRADPYSALSQLGERLANPLQPHEVLPTVARSVGEALKLPYVAIRLGATPEESELVAQHGHSRDWPRLTVLMTHGGTRVGELVAEARAPDERFGKRERRLLEDLAGQAAPAAQSARLAGVLRQANEEFDREREEDLQRITDDLHDGIGPSVVGISLQIDAVRKLTKSEDPRIRRQLGQALDDLCSISSQVRELIRNIPPRDLRRGLLDAVRTQADRFTGPLDVCVTTGEMPDRIPSAVEVAAYRIVCEALNNAVRHANARTCRIHLNAASDLELTILDDGDGIPRYAIDGLGLQSMRRRCEELHGTFAIMPLSPGTQIVARLPLG